MKRKTEYHRFNMTDEISSALENLSLATHNERDILTHLAYTKNKLAIYNNILIEQLNTDINNCSKISNLIKSNGNNSQETNLIRKDQHKCLDPNIYLWSHFYKVIKRHTIKNCYTKLMVHKYGATRSNIMVGSKSSKDLKPE